MFNYCVITLTVQMSSGCCCTRERGTVLDFTCVHEQHTSNSLPCTLVNGSGYPVAVRLPAIIISQHETSAQSLVTGRTLQSVSLAHFLLLK